MKRIQFYADTNRSGNLLHIETDLGIVNIRVGLHDADGKPVTSVEIIPDAGVVLTGAYNSRLVAASENQTKGVIK